MELDILIHDTTLITMDEGRRVLYHASIGIEQSRISVICPAAEAKDFTAKRIVDGSGKLVMPGIIDSHAHAGHGLTKTLGTGGIGMPGPWDDFMEAIYFRGTTVDFWYAEARLSGLERLKFGVTTGMSMLGSYPRAPSAGCSLLVRSMAPRATKRLPPRACWRASMPRCRPMARMVGGRAGTKAIWACWSTT